MVTGNWSKEKKKSRQLLLANRKFFRLFDRSMHYDCLDQLTQNKMY